MTKHISTIIVWVVVFIGWTHLINISYEGISIVRGDNYGHIVTSLSDTQRHILGVQKVCVYVTH